MMMSIRRNVSWVALGCVGAPLKTATHCSDRRRLWKSVGFAEHGSGCSSTATRFERESLLGECRVRLDAGGVPVCLWGLAESSDWAGYAGGMQ
jgi:hypothetical protein